MPVIIRITSEMAQKWLGDCPPDKVFWTNDGRTLKNTRELEAALREMSDDTYRYHVTTSNNDFANWVRDVFGDDKLSRDLAKSVTREQAAKALAERIAFLKKKV